MEEKKSVTESIMTLGDIAPGAKAHISTAAVAAVSAGAIIADAVIPHMEGAMVAFQSAVGVNPIASLVLSFIISFIKAGIDRKRSA